MGKGFLAKMKDRWFSAGLLGCALMISMTATAGEMRGQGAGLVLSGQTMHPLLAEAEVEVRFGQTVVESTTDSGGRFDISIDCADDDAIVMLFVRGQGSQQHIRSSRVVDSCASLIQQADGSGHFQTGPVSAVSTSVYGLLRWYVEDSPALEWPLNAEGLLRVRPALAGDVAMRSVNVLVAITDGLIELPDGIDQTLDLLLDRDQFLALEFELLSEVDPDLSALARRRVLWDARLNFRTEALAALDGVDVYCPAIASDCSASYLAGQEQDYFSNQNVGGPAESVLRAWQDIIHGDNFEPVEDNLRALRLTGPQGESLFESQAFVFVPGVGQVPAIIGTKYKDFRLLNASEALPLGSIVSKVVRSFPEHELPDEVIKGQVPGFRSVLSSDAALLPWSGPNSGEVWQIPLFLEPVQESGFRPARWDWLTFGADGQVVAELSGETLHWTFEDDVLVLESADLGQHQYRYLGGDFDRHPLFKVTRQPASEDMRSVIASLVRGNEVEITASEVPGRYVGGFDLDEYNPLPSWLSAGFFVFNLDADGTGWQANMEDPSASARPDDAIDVTWQIDQFGRVYIKRPFSPEMAQHRAWTFIRHYEPTEDFFVIELGPFTAFDPSYELANIPGRLNFYRRIEVAP